MGTMRVKLCMTQPSGLAARRRRILGALATAAVIASLGSTGAASAAVASPATPLSCSATVTSHYPKIGTSVGVKVHSLAGIRIRVIAHFKHGTAKKTGHANSAGKQTVWYRLKSDTTPGYRVKVDVTVFRGKRAAYCSTWFTPQAKHRGGGHGGGAWCTATATVYNAQYDENNVYVNSNQPYTDATASADGYSWSYETNGNGYALIYLNGPPPGAEITVTVGGATCYTGD
jgi:hypothetical protein